MSTLAKLNLTSGGDDAFACFVSFLIFPKKEQKYQRNFFMADEYQSRLDLLQENWQTRHATWQRQTCPRLFYLGTVILALCMTLGLTLSFTLVPPRFRGVSVFCSLFVPIYFWALLVAVSVAGMLRGEQSSPCCVSCSDFLWTCCLQMAFLLRCNQQVLAQDPDAHYENLTQLLLDIQQEHSMEISEQEEPQISVNVFETPQRLARAQMQLKSLNIYNEKLAQELPSLLNDTGTFGPNNSIPLEIVKLIYDFVL
jgi:hypothetical protein